MFRKAYMMRRKRQTWLSCYIPKSCIRIPSILNPDLINKKNARKNKKSPDPEDNFCSVVFTRKLRDVHASYRQNKGWML